MEGKYDTCMFGFFPHDRMDPSVHKVLHSPWQTAADSRLIHAGLRQAERRGKKRAQLSLLNIYISSEELNLIFVCRRRLNARDRKLRNSRRTRRAGWKSQEATKAPRLGLTAKLPTRGLCRGRAGRIRGKSWWTSTPGSTGIRRKNVSFSLYYTWLSRHTTVKRELKKKCPPIHFLPQILLNWGRSLRRINSG